jgi:prophage maintenance system killer protein
MLLFNLNRFFLNLSFSLCVLMVNGSVNAEASLSSFRKMTSKNTVYKGKPIPDGARCFKNAVELTIQYLVNISWQQSYSPHSFLSAILKIHQEITGESARYLGVPAALGFTGGFRKRDVFVLNASRLRVMGYGGAEIVALCQNYVAGGAEAAERLKNHKQAQLCYEAYYLAPGPDVIKNLLYDYARELIKRDSQKNCDTWCAYAFAAFAHNRFLEIHPFEDGNGRTARLIANAILFKNGISPFNIDRCDPERRRTMAVFLTQDKTQRDKLMAEFFRWCLLGYNY